MNIGTIGHVAHGKTTVVRAISTVHTIRHKNELIRNITIKLGYANAKIYKCDSPDCPPPGCYHSFGSASPDVIDCPQENCSGKLRLMRCAFYLALIFHVTNSRFGSRLDLMIWLVAALSEFPYFVDIYRLLTALVTTFLWQLC